MKKTNKRMISLVMVMVIMASVAMAVEITDPMLIIHSKTSAEWVNYDDRYVDGDMFANFKKIMPGDEKTQTVYIQNAWNDWDYINLYMIAELHTDGLPNPMSDKVNEAQKGETEADKLAYMHDFLNQLTLEIKNEDRVLYKGNPDELAVGFENGKVQLRNTEKLGIIENGDIVKLDVTLTVPKEMDNTYANRVGEVDWVFTYEGRDYPDDPDPTTKPTTGPTEPTTGPTSPTEPTDPTIDIDDPDIPLDPVDPDNPSSPDTGDHSNMLPYIVLFIVGLMGLILTSKKRKIN